jgi:two-component sensor histidine kinase
MKSQYVSSPRKEWSILWRYGGSLLTVSAALVLTLALPPLHLTPTVPFFAAIVFVAWFGGRGPALITVLVSILSVDYFIVSPRLSALSNVADVVRFLAFAGVAYLICFLQDRNQHIAALLREANDDLELRVQRRTAELAVANWSLHKEIEERRRVEDALRVSECNLRGTLERVAVSLKEKDVLLRELHHRVKNNLQIISSLFSMQAKKIQDPAAKALFKECQDRVRTIALVHEKLFKVGDLSHIDLANYYRDLVNNLFRSFGRNPAVIVPAIHVDCTALDIDRLIPCALIVNELVSNSLKYAFPEDRSGKNRVDLRRPNDHVTLTVADDGVGASSSPARTATGDGLQIVQALVDQLAGKLEITNGQGMTYRVTFPGNNNGVTHVEYADSHRRG